MREARHDKPKIDVHVHYLPPDYRRAAKAAGHQHPDGMPRLPDWDVETALSMMDGLNIRTAMLSGVSPGVHFGDDAAARALARSVNEQGAAAVAAHPGRFGLFAALPLPDVDGAVHESAYAFGHLAADDGVVLTNQSGLYPGDPKLYPLMAELDRRRATGDALHPLQEAFLRHDAFQCGYCTPGQTCSAQGLINEGHAHGRDEVRKAMSGNLCRCGAYANIADAVMDVLAQEKRP